MERLDHYSVRMLYRYVNSKVNVEYKCCFKINGNRRTSNPLNTIKDEFMDCEFTFELLNNSTVETCYLHQTDKKTFFQKPKKLVLILTC